MDRTQRWKLADELTVFQIALLIAGYDPAEFDRDRYSAWPDEVKIEISPFLNAIKNAARSGKLQFIKEVYEGLGTVEINWDDSIINIDSLIAWMKSRSFVDGFFIQKSEELDAISNKLAENYAPKLAAAVRAWNEVTSDPEALNGKTPKKALEIWLRKHANEYGLTDKDGNPNRLGIEEICKVANWKPGGGASPTPATSAAPPEAASSPAPDGRKVRPRPTTPSNKTPSFGRAPAPIDDDIPF